MRIYTNAYDAQAGVWCIDEWKKQTSGHDDQNGKGFQRGGVRPACRGFATRVPVVAGCE